MTPVTLRLTLIAFLGLASMTITAQVIGQQHTPHPALAGFRQDCAHQAQPCWRGIIPGITTVGELATILTGKGYRRTEDGAGTPMYWQPGDLCSRIWLGYRDNLVTRLGMSLCDDARLGDLALIFDEFYTVTQSGLTMLNGQVVIGLPAGDNGACMNFKPRGRVAQIWLSAERITYTQSIIPRWRGYLPFARYHKWYDLDCRPLGKLLN